MKTLMTHRQRNYTLGAILVLCGAMIFCVEHIAAQQAAAHSAVIGETAVKSGQDRTRVSLDDGEQFAVEHADELWGA